MINNYFQLTDHARDRMRERFPNLRIGKELRTLSYCDKEEVLTLKRGESYKRTKKGSRNNFYFYRSKNNVYFVCEAKKQNKGVFYNVVITVVDLKTKGGLTLNEEEYFQAQAIEAAYQMSLREKAIEENGRPKAKRNKKKKGDKTAQTVKQVVNKQKDKFESVLHKLRSKTYIDFDYKKEDFNSEKSCYITRHLDKLNKMANKYENACLHLKKYEDTEDSKKKLSIQKQLNEMVFGIIKPILIDTIDFNLVKNEDFKQFYMDFLADVLQVKSKILAICYINSGSLSKTKYNELFKVFNKIKVEFPSTEKLDLALTEVSEFLINYHRDEMYSIYKRESTLVKRINIEKAVAQLQFLKMKDETLLNKIDGFINFYNVIIDKFNDIGYDSFYVRDYM